MSERPPSPPDPKKPAGFMDRLAAQSTGLPERGATPPGPTKADQEERSAGWRVAGIGIQFAGTVALFTFFGVWLDKHFGWAPWGTVTLAMIAVIGNTYLLIKEGLKQDQKHEK